MSQSEGSNRTLVLAAMILAVSMTFIDQVPARRWRQRFRRRPGAEPLGLES